MSTLNLSVQRVLDMRVLVLTPFILILGGKGVKGLANLWFNDQVKKLLANIPVECLSSEYASINVELSIADHLCYMADETCKRLSNLL